MDLPPELHRAYRERTTHHEAAVVSVHVEFEGTTQVVVDVMRPTSLPLYGIGSETPIDHVRGCRVERLHMSMETFNHTFFVPVRRSAWAWLGHV